MFSFCNYIILSIKGNIKKMKLKTHTSGKQTRAHVNINNKLFIVTGTIEICYYRGELKTGGNGVTRILYYKINVDRIYS